MSDPVPEQPKPVQLTKKVITGKQVEEMCAPLFKDMSNIVDSGNKLAEKKKADARSLLWKYVQSLTDKNLAAVYWRYKDEPKMQNATAYDFVKHEICQRFSQKAFYGSSDFLQPFRVQDQ
jgi:hypothetical protein